MPGKKKYHIPKEWLEEQYTKNKKTTRQIAAELHCTKYTAWKLLVDAGIPRRAERTARKNVVAAPRGNKICPGCNKELPQSAFHKHSARYDGLQAYCKTCIQEQLHESGKKRPMGEATDCSLYLGVHIAEELLANYFDNMQRMPPNNPGFDFICGKNFKIDVKSACLDGNNKRRWAYQIDKNQTADYFLCIAFTDRESLNPEHVWLIPGNVLNGKICVSISKNTLRRWEKYERPLDGLNGPKEPSQRRTSEEINSII